MPEHFFMTLAVFMALQYKPAVLNYTTRFVDFADYMLLHGITLFPIAEDLKPYPDYTVLNTLLVYLVSLPFGRVSVLSMGFPSCVAASLMLVFIYRLGALHSKKWGRTAFFQSADLGFSRRRQLAGTGYLSGAVNGDVLLLCLYGRDQKRPAPPGVSVRRAGTGFRFSWAYRLDRTCECHWRLLLTEPAVAHVAAVFTARG
jgi:hypothetical protein